MTAKEFKSRLAAGDKLAVVMHALYKINPPSFLFERARGGLARERKYLRDDYQEDAAHILAALASAEAKRT